MFNLFKHLLPLSTAWNLTVDRVLRQLFEGTIPSFEDAVEFFDLVWLDLFPESTRHLTQWEAQFGIESGTNVLTDQDRIDRIDALWKATGGQSPRYIQDTLRNAGFDVYVHDWWVPGSGPPPTVRDRTSFTKYWLVNKLYTAIVDYTVGCGEALMECGEAGAECGENNGIIFDRTEYPWPPFLPGVSDPRFVMYIGGATWPQPTMLPIDRMDEFEDLCLKICPAHLWIGMMIEYGAYIVDDVTGDYVVDDATGRYLLG